MHDMYETSARGDMIFAKLILDDIKVCEECLRCYPLETPINIILASKRKLKGVFNFASAGGISVRTPHVDIAKKSFLEQLGWDEVNRNFVLGKVFFPKKALDTKGECAPGDSIFSKGTLNFLFDKVPEDAFDTLEAGDLNEEWVTLRARNQIQPRGKCIPNTSRCICGRCGALIYWSRDRFLIENAFDDSKMYLCAGLIFPATIYERIKNLNWRNIALYKPYKMKIISRPVDGFPIDLHENCPVSFPKHEEALDYVKKQIKQ